MTVYVPVGVDDEVEIVNVLENVGLPEDGLKLAEAPEGKPEAERLTDFAEPLVRVTLTVVVMLLPTITVPLDGLTDIEKSKGSSTIRVKIAVLVNPPPVPFIVTVYVPAGVDELADIVKVLVNVGFPEDGSKLADAPDGNPVTARPTDLEGPSTNVTVTVVDMLPPSVTVPLVGLTETEKSNGLVTVNV